MPPVLMPPVPETPAGACAAPSAVATQALADTLPGAPVRALAEVHADRAADAPADAALRRLRWRARRGMLENDLLLERYLGRHGKALSAPAAEALAQLLELPDGELLELLLGRAEPGAALAGAAVRDVLQQLRAA
jgi:antitoxin CptB